MVEPQVWFVNIATFSFAKGLFMMAEFFPRKVSATLLHFSKEIGPHQRYITYQRSGSGNINMYVSNSTFVPREY